MIFHVIDCFVKAMQQSIKTGEVAAVASPVTASMAASTLASNNKIIKYKIIAAKLTTYT